MHVVRVNQHAVKTAYPGHFTGRVWLEQLLGVTDPSRLHLRLVPSEPSDHSNRHRNKLGQVLYRLSSIGRVQPAGMPVQKIRPSNTVAIPAEEIHSHGASPDRALMHLLTAEVSDSGVGTVWLHAVTDAEFHLPVPEVT